MSITLKIISYQRLTPGQQESFQTDLDRLSIGRNPDNDWALPDPQRFMSGTHCWLEQRNGAWFITDKSTNGVFLNGSDQRLTRNESQALSHADRIRLGDYELEVDLQSGVTGVSTAVDTTPELSTDPFVNDEKDIFKSPNVDQPDSSRKLKEANTPLSQMDNNLLGDSVSIDELYHLDEDEKEEEEPVSLASQGDQVSPLREHFSAPEVEQEPRNPLLDKYSTDFGDMSDNWDDDPETGLIKSKAEDLPADSDHKEPDSQAVMSEQEQESSSAVSPPSRPDQESAPPRSSVRSRQAAQGIKADSAIAAFAAGADLKLDLLGTQDEKEFFHDLGVLLKTMTEGLMQAISSRGQIKSEFRLEQTMIAPRENNPLKFSVSAQDAMMRLLNRTENAYMSGTAAAAEAIDDINAHQMAVLAGTEAALKSILRRFKPDSLESKFGGSSLLGRALPLLNKAKYWEFYKILYDEVSEAADDDFQQLFGVEFSNAYEKQLDRLKLSRKEPSK